jgi:recombination protein RecR
VDLRPPSVRELLQELEQLPGVGPRTAVRLVQHLLQTGERTQRLAAALERAGGKVRRCTVCYLPSEDETCPACRDEGRDHGVICVVEDALNAWAIEATGEFRGVYHVLLGALDPLHGVGPDELTTAPLFDRVRSGAVSEVILATNPTVEGEATAHYLAQLARQHRVKPSRLTHGVPLGGELEYVDRGTLSHAFGSRSEMPQ